MAKPTITPHALYEASDEIRKCVRFLEERGVDDRQIVQEAMRAAGVNLAEVVRRGTLSMAYYIEDNRPILTTMGKPGGLDHLNGCMEIDRLRKASSDSEYARGIRDMCFLLRRNPEPRPDDPDGVLRKWLHADQENPVVMIQTVAAFLRLRGDELAQTTPGAATDEKPRGTVTVVNQEPPPARYRCEWYFEASGEQLDAELLRQALRRGSITGEKINGRNHYDLVSVCSCYPQHAKKIKEFLDA